MTFQGLAGEYARIASRNSTKTAVFYGEKEISYHHQTLQAAWVAKRLRSQFGVRPGDRVALWMRNCPEFVPILFGILATGAVVVPINNFLKPVEVAYMADDAGAVLLIAGDGQDVAEVAARVRELHPPDADRGILPTWVVTQVEFVAEGSLAFDWIAHRSADDLAVIIYTSGTTGKPKGAMLTHGNLQHNVASCRVILEVVELDRFVLMLPMFHSFMLTVCIFLPMLSGGTIVLIQSLTPAKAMLGEIIRNRGTVLPAMAQVFRALSQVPEGVDLSCLRLCISGAGPLPAEILKAFNGRHPAVPLIEGYGLSEASPVVSVNPVRGPWIPGTIGVPIPDVEVSVQDDSGGMLPDGVDGEICVRGGNVMRGYWNAPEKTADSFRNGWLLTGDIGHRRADGYFVITDRKKDMLKPNGINVYPREIEEVIYRFPGVKECAVVGEPDERRGERPVAFVAMDEGKVLDERGLLAFLKENLADYKLPRRAITLPALPRNATGKILKTELRRMLG